MVIYSTRTRTHEKSMIIHENSEVYVHGWWSVQVCVFVCVHGCSHVGLSIDSGGI